MRKSSSSYRLRPTSSASTLQPDPGGQPGEGQANTCSMTTRAPWPGCSPGSTGRCPFSSPPSSTHAGRRLNPAPLQKNPTLRPPTGGMPSASPHPPTPTPPLAEQAPGRPSLAHRKSRRMPAVRCASPMLWRSMYTSSAMVGSTPGRCTLTATSCPSAASVARYTCVVQGRKRRTGRAAHHNRGGRPHRAHC
jgi:hypothetical protein